MDQNHANQNINPSIELTGNVGISNNKEISKYPEILNTCNVHLHNSKENICILAEFAQQCVLNNDFSNQRISINVGGTHYEIMIKNLLRLPHSRLGKIVYTHAKPPEITCQLCDGYSSSTETYYFDRSTKSFECIIGYYRTGKLHMSRDLCPVEYCNELEYWGVEEYLIEPCCQTKYFKRIEIAMDELKNVNIIKNDDNEELFIGNWSESRRFIWNLMEKPNSSPASKAVAILSLLFIGLSLANLTISTLPSVRQKSINASSLFSTVAVQTNISPQVSPTFHSNHHEPFEIFVIESCCMTWFTFEYLLRFFSSPNKLKFIKGILNAIDLLAILPFFVTLIIEITYLKDAYKLASLRKLLPTFRVLRIMRILKLARHSVGLQSLGFTLRQCYKELSMLGIFLMTTILVFSSLIYFAEREDNSEMFKSIPHSFWWAAITITTVGYGDIYPNSLLGKIIGTFCCICGVIVIALPIPIIVNNFAGYYNQQLRRDKSLEMQRNRRSGSAACTSL